MSNSQRDVALIDCEDYALGIERNDATPEIAPNREFAHASRMQELAQTIESAIIPRLLISDGLQHRFEERIAIDLAPTDVSAETVEKFVDSVMSQDSAQASQFIDTLLARGMRIETLLLHVMAPAARHLGDMWTADLCDFVDVTLALSRLNQILRRIGTGFRDPVHESAQERRALLVPTPGEQHTFGLRIVEEFLLRDGWHVRSNLRASRDEIVDLAAEDHYQVVGFSLSGELLVGELAAIIRDVRRSSQNRTIRVIVGGVIFHEHPHLLGILDADAIAFDAQHAVSLANKWRQRSR